MDIPSTHLINFHQCLCHMHAVVASLLTCRELGLRGQRLLLLLSQKGVSLIPGDSLLEIHQPNWPYKFHYK